MGNWQLEVFRMSLYIMFPVGMFHLFNQPENYDKWVTKVREERFPEFSSGKEAEILKFIEDFNRQAELKRLDKMEKEYKQRKEIAKS